MSPWHDCPACPACGSRCGVPDFAWDWNHRANEDDRIACPACGSGWVGTEAQYAKAVVAQLCWEWAKAVGEA